MRGSAIKLMLLITGCFFLTVPAIAADLPGGFSFDNPTCFARKYTARHMAAHPQQKVSYIRFEHFPNLWGGYDENNKVSARAAPNSVYYQIIVQLRGSNRLLNDSGECRMEGKRLRCYIECDGGSFDFVRESAGKVLIRNRGFSVSGCDEGISINRLPDDKAFRLTRLPQSQCREPLVAGPG